MNRSIPFTLAMIGLTEDFFASERNRIEIDMMRTRLKQRGAAMKKQKEPYEARVRRRLSKFK